MLLEWRLIDNFDAMGNTIIMKRLSIRLALILTSLCLFANTSVAAESVQTVPDSVFFAKSNILYDSIRTPSFDKMYKEMLRLTKEADNERYYITTRRMLISKYSMEKNIKAFVNESDKLIKDCKESGTDVAVRLLYEVYNFKADRLDMWGMKDQALKTAEEMSSYAQENQHMKGLAMSQYLFGGWYLNSHQLDEAERCLKKAWDICDSEGLRELQVRVGMSLLAVMIDTESYEEGLAMAKRVREVIALRAAGGAHIAPVNMQKLASRTCKLLYMAGKADEAEIQRDSMYYWFSLDKDPSQLMNILNTDAYFNFSTGRYDEACFVLDSLTRMAERNNNWSEIANFTYALAISQSELGNKDAAVANFKRYAEAKDSAAVQDCREQLDELSKKYEVAELQWAAKRLRYRLSLSFAAVLLLLLVLGFELFYTTRLLEKNKALYEKVRQFDKHAESQAETVLAAVEVESPLAAIFKKVTSALKDQKLFSDPSLNRDSLAAAVGTNSKYLADAVREYSDGKTVNDLINWWRLHEASILLREAPLMQIVEVGEEAGFGSSQTFYRLFKEHFGMTPSEYRKVASTLAS